MGRSCIKSFWKVCIEPNLMWLLIILLFISSLWGFSVFKHILPWWAEAGNTIVGFPKVFSHTVLPKLEKDLYATEIQSFLYWLTGFGTLLLAVVAFFKVGKLNKENQAQFLLRIDDRWGSAESVKARVIIHRLYREEQINAAKDSALTGPNCEIAYEVARRIRDMSEDQDSITRKPCNVCKTEILGNKSGVNSKSEKTPSPPCVECIHQNQDDFIILLSFLDFMETIGYLYAQQHVTLKNLQALCGESLSFNYKVFSTYIHYKRCKHNSSRDKFYNHFEDLYHDLQNNGSRCGVCSE